MTLHLWVSSAAIVTNRATGEVRKYRPRPSAIALTHSRSDPFILEEDRTVPDWRRAESIENYGPDGW